MELSTVQQIERAIAGLSAEERDGLLAWVDQQYAQPIDVQLQQDLLSGRLDDRLMLALAEDGTGKTRLL